jgi:hypothetical protein
MVMPLGILVQLSRYFLDRLRDDGEFILSRTHAKQRELPSVLLLAPASTRPSHEAFTVKSKSTPPIHLAGSPFGDQRHVCAFFHSPEEEDRVLLLFIKDGFDCGDRAFHVVDPDQRKEHLQRLESVGIDTARAESSGQLKVYGWDEAHIDPDGRFDQYRMISLKEEEPLQENPFFVPPDEFLRELRETRAAQTN